MADDGFTGDNIMMAGHSLGGVFSQQYANSNPDQIKGLILMGATIARTSHEINDDGTTHFNFAVPTLTMGGEKDGLMRISRVAEAWWH